MIKNASVTPFLLAIVAFKKKVLFFGLARLTQVFSKSTYSKHVFMIAISKIGFWVRLVLVIKELKSESSNFNCCDKLVR